MSNNITFWLAIDEDGAEAIYECKPEWRFSKTHGYYWYSFGEPYIYLPTGQIKAWGYNIKPGQSIEIIGPNYDSKDEWYEQ